MSYDGHPKAIIPVAILHQHLIRRTFKLMSIFQITYPHFIGIATLSISADYLQQIM